MKTTHAAIAAIAACTLITGSAIGGIGNFLINNTRGDLYRVNGQTLEATVISELDAFNNLNEILYDGESSILYNDGRRIVRHNYITQQETVVFDTPTGLGEFSVSAGLARAGDNSLYYSATHFIGGDSTLSVITANLDSQEATVAHISDYYSFFDHHMVSENQFIGATFGDREIVFINSVTGVVEDRFAVNASIVSFFENSNGLFAMTKEGELHMLDLDERSLSYIGQINGTIGNLIGATIPAPSSIVPIAITLLAARRRRN